MKYSKCEFCGAYHTGNELPINCMTCGAILPAPQYVRDEAEFRDMVEAAKMAISEANGNGEVKGLKELQQIYDELQEKYKECSISAYYKMVCNSSKIISDEIIANCQKELTPKIKTCNIACIISTLISLCLTFAFAPAYGMQTAFIIAFIECVIGGAVNSVKEHSFYKVLAIDGGITEDEARNKIKERILERGGKLTQKRQKFDEFLAEKTNAVNRLVSTYPECKDSELYQKYRIFCANAEPVDGWTLRHNVQEYYQGKMNKCENNVVNIVWVCLALLTLSEFIVWGLST